MSARDAGPLNKKPTATAEHIGSMEVPYGRLSINAGSASDHAAMRSAQLSGLFVLMMGDGPESFGLLSNDIQSSLFWLGQQLAQEVQECIPLIAKEAAGVKS